jgi:hypothetical protein
VLDAHDVLADGRDVPLVSAALLSARFPLLEPPARVGSREQAPRGCPTTGPLTAVRVRDGGYMENTGLRTIVDLLPAIRDQLRSQKADVPIIVVSIDDDPEVAIADPEREEPRPAPGSVATKVSDGYLSRQARDALSSCQFPDVTYLRISPEPHVGAHAATGWEISETGRRRDLGQALRSGSEALKDVSLVQQWLDGVRHDTGCRPTAAMTR